MERRPTIIDVARVAGISKSTVSLVLQNSPLVKEETRLLVREAMDKVGYVYNRAAEFGSSIAATVLAWLEEGKRPQPETLTAEELVVRDTSGERRNS